MMKTKTINKILLLLSTLICFSILVFCSSGIVFADEIQKGSSANGYVLSMQCAPAATAAEYFDKYEPTEGMNAFNMAFNTETTYYSGLHFSGSATSFGFKIEIDNEKFASLDNMWIRISTNPDITAVDYNNDFSISSATYYTSLSSVTAELSYLEEREVYFFIGPKTDSNGDGSINSGDIFDADKTDIYVIGLQKDPGLLDAKFKDSGNINFTPEFNSANYTREYQFSTGSETIKVTLNTDFSGGVVLWLGEKSYTSRLKNVELNLSDFQDPDTLDVIIPIRLICSNSDATQTNETYYEFKMHGPAPVITVQPEDINCDKGDEVTLSISIEEKEGDVISYQWLANGNPIEGATSSTYCPPTDTAGTIGYSCRVTNTVDEREFSSVSKTANVTVNLSYLNPPVFGRQPGSFKKVSNVIQDCPDTYTYGQAFDAWVEIVNPEPGTYVSDIKFYYNASETVEGAIEVPMTWRSAGNSGIAGHAYYYYECTTSTLPVGEWYVFAVVTISADGDSTLESVSAASGFCKLTYTEYEVPLDGSGTEEDPFQLKTAEDFEVIRDAVNNLHISFAGVYFDMVNDITLNDGWTPIGTIVNASTEDIEYYPFSGILDGGNHTLSYPEESLPLFYIVNSAVIKNLKIYGSKIDGAGLVNSAYKVYGVTGATIDSVTIVSGTSTKESGLVNFNVTYTNPFVITNCKVEEGVVIGYTKEEISLGSLAGGITGTVDNCESAATVYGESAVGGIVGSQSNSVGKLVITNCIFTGTVEGNGAVGGIVGMGYSSETAPNAFCMTIENNTVTGVVKGTVSIGGIIGAEVVDQCWDNGIGYVRNNSFTGTVSGESKVGGIAGTYRSLNRYTIIENNYYSKDCGATSGFGFVAHVDTNAIEFGMHDGVMYYSTENLDYPEFPDYLWKQKYTEEQWEEINYVVEVEPGWRDMGRWVDSSITKANHHRTDDPLGADAEKLCYTDKITDIEVTETPTKTEYVLGEELDLTGLVVSANWYPEATTEIDPEDLEISGFDSSTEGEQEITVTYGDFTTTFKVTVTHVEYEFLEGVNGTWIADSDEGLKFRVDMPFDKFTTVDVDGETLDSSKYAASEGSTVVVLDKDYLNGLTAGSHTIRVNANDGYAETSFTIKPAGGSAATGEDIDPGLWIMMTVAVAIGVASIPVIRRRRRSRA